MNSASYQPPRGPFTPLSYQAPAGNVATKSRTGAGYVPPAYSSPGDTSTGYNRSASRNNSASDPVALANALANAKTGLFPSTERRNLAAKGYSSGGFSAAEGFAAQGSFSTSRDFNTGTHFDADRGSASRLPTFGANRSDRDFDSYQDNLDIDDDPGFDSEHGIFSRGTLTSMFRGGRKTYAYIAGIALVLGGITATVLSIGGNSDVEPDKTTAVQPVDVSTIPSVQLSTDPATTMAEAAVSTPSVGPEMLSKMADVYVNNWHFSAARVIQILTSSEVTHASPEGAQTALDSLGPVDWNGVALAAAQDAIANDGVPVEEVRDYLLSPDIGFTEEQAQFAVDNLKQIP